MSKSYNVEIEYTLTETVHVIARDEEHAKELALSELKWSPYASLSDWQTLGVRDAENGIDG